MRQHGRKSITNLTTLQVDGSPPRLEPPGYLTKPERSLFIELVAACSPRHFVLSDVPLIVSFVQSTLLSRNALKSADKDAAALTTWERATRLQATLATRLRLAPQARLDPKTVGRFQPRSGRVPWE